jgi:SpoIIAA-like
MTQAAKNRTNNSVVVLPESDHQTLCVSLFDVVSEPDYKNNFYSTLKTFVENGQIFNLLINYDSTFKGWDREAAELSFQSIIDYGNKTRKMAYVNAPDSKMLQTKLTGSLLSGEVRFFEAAELKNAIHWVKN